VVEEGVLEKPVTEERVLVRDMVDEDVAVEVACVDEVLMMVGEDDVKDVDEDNVLVRDTDVAHVHGQS